MEATIDGGGCILKKKVLFPILISLRDNEGHPVEDAFVALEELGVNLSTDEEIVREAKSRTDENGMIVVMHPAMVPVASPESFTTKIQSVVSIVTKGHRAVTIKLQDHFKEGLYVHSETTVPHLKLVLPDQPKGDVESEKNAPKGDASEK